MAETAEARKDEILKATAVELSATVVVHTGPAQITKRRPPRRGKHAEVRAPLPVSAAIERLRDCSGDLPNMGAI